MRKTLTLCLAVVLVVSLSGCAAVKKKFTRKKKEQPISTVMHLEEEFVKPYSNEYYYSSHFNMWKVWHEELLKFLDGNQKRRHRAGREVIAHLDQMKSYLSRLISGI